MRLTSPHPQSQPHHPYPFKCIHYSPKVECKCGARGDGQRLLPDAGLLVWVLTGQLIGDLVEDDDNAEHNAQVGNEGEGSEAVEITYPTAQDDQGQNYDNPQPH